MFKTLLANNARKVNSSIQRKKLDDTVCAQYISSGSVTLDADRKYCYTGDGFFLIGTKGAKIAYVNDDNSLSRQTSNAIGAISPYVESDKQLKEMTFQIIVSEAGTYAMYTDIEISLSDTQTLGSITVDSKTKVYLSLKKNFEGRITSYSKLENKKGVMKDVYLYFFNPNGAAISANNEENTISYLDEEEIKDTLTAKTSGMVNLKNSKMPEINYDDGEEDEDEGEEEEVGNDASGEEELPNGEWPAAATITIKGNDGTIELPEKFFELTPDTIYTLSTSDATIVDFLKSDDDDKLSAGAIAGIVVACVVVVGGVVGFCVYWFVFRKKAPVESINSNEKENGDEKKDEAAPQP